MKSILLAEKKFTLMILVPWREAHDLTQKKKEIIYNATKLLLVVGH